MSDGADQRFAPPTCPPGARSNSAGWRRPSSTRVRQKLVLGPVEGSPRECFKVLSRLDGSEYFLLENRTAKGSTPTCPAGTTHLAGQRRPADPCEESHGVAGPKGPTVHLKMVPYPSKANSAFTPITTPSSRAAAGGGLPVHITNIRRLADGRVTLHVGYEYR